MVRRIIAVAVLLLTLATSASAAPTTYILEWHSEWPIAADTIAVEVWGGSFVGSEIADDGKSGRVAATADRECLSITWRADTIAAFPVAIVRSWTDACHRMTHLPIVIS